MPAATSPAPEPASNRSQLADIFGLYTALFTKLLTGSDEGLGGKLLYAGELSGKNLLFAANIAGAASIGASAHPAIQRGAMRDGAIDFLVTSLEEALRILKNEIRKHQPVSVGVGIAPTLLVAQMLDRGVLPDLIAPGMESDSKAMFLSQGALEIATSDSTSEGFVTWAVEKDFARALPQLDAIARLLIPETDRLRHRWLRLAPRYLGRVAQREHGVALSDLEFTKFASEVARWVESERVSGNRDLNVVLAGSATKIL